MTVGEKLLQLRRQKGLSQEELAQQLLVSRQTISLWETNQSLPTIENLIRLRDIFGVSVDEILMPADAASAPLQTFAYTLTPDDYQACFQVYNQVYFRRNHFGLGLGIFMLLAGLAIEGISIPFLALGVFLICLAIRNLRMLNQQKTQLPTCCPEARWALYETDFTVSYYHDGTLSHYVRHPYSDIQKSWQCTDKLALLIKNTIYILPAGFAGDGSPLQSVIRKTLPAEGSKSALEKRAGILFWITIASLFLSAWLALLLPNLFGGFGTAYMWLMWLALPVPIACIFLGFRLKKRGLQWKKQVICGSVIAALLLLFGSYTFLFRYADEDATEYLARVEQEILIDFPESEYAHVTSNVNSVTGNTQIFLLSHYYASLSSYDQKALTERLAADLRWFTDVPYDLLPCVPLSYVNQGADYYLIFDATAQAFNTIPTKPGTHTMFYITYSATYGSLEIVEYEYICN